ncbi:hypothetical protein [Roseateles saccharophilus]|uniref:Uncharacterized protein n=1 Tax=Roseateles saccharophilus TaxID=304 RepID=A0A4R3UGI7_ROSSA|nr:hypothetical protein [Roseateles saccharophilus]MDG0835232.1 hypothetical protein [Roseateles saccharophilus]TCU86876.1 hypothetical protein EV671_104530 [Roseateles saccharophilus]
MRPTRTAELISRMPHWFIDQVRAVEARARGRQEAWEEVRRCNDALARRAALEDPRAIKVNGGGWDDWPDTVAVLNAE